MGKLDNIFLRVAEAGLETASDMFLELPAEIGERTARMIERVPESSARDKLAEGVRILGLAPTVAVIAVGSRFCSAFAPDA